MWSRNARATGKAGLMQIKNYETNPSAARVATTKHQFLHHLAYATEKNKLQKRTQTNPRCSESREAEGDYCLAGGCRDVLTAVQSVADGRGDDRAAGLKSPQEFAGLGVKGDQVALGVAHKHQAAGGRQDASGGAAHRFEVPREFAGLRIDGVDAPVSRLIATNGAALIPLAFFELLFGLVEQHAPFGRSEIIES